MANLTIIINGIEIKLIRLGECACGCGKKTHPYKNTDKRYGHIKGIYAKRLQGHRCNQAFDNNPNWRGGVTVTTDGYICTKVIAGNCNIMKGYKRNHIILAEKAFGKPLPKNAEVHHYHIDKRNYDLVICEDHAYHLFIEQRTRAYKACGHANWRKCSYCKQYDAPENLYIDSKYKTARHKICFDIYKRQRKLNHI